MIIKYDEFINENLDNKKPEDFGITDYEWVNGKLDCFQNVTFYQCELEKIPFVFGKVDGSFSIRKNKISNLVNAPYEVTGLFECSNNPYLTSLEGCPTIVGNNFFCGSTPKLKNLDFIPKHLNFNLFINKTPKIKTIDQYPITIIEQGIHKDKVCSEIFDRVCHIIFSNREIFETLMNDKIKFHQMVMRLDLSLIKYYKTIPPPSKKSLLLNL